MPTEVLLTRWDGARARSAAGLLAVPAGQIVPWLVNPLPPTILGAAGLMELFGHGQDIADALGVRRVHTDRIKHLVDFSVRVRDFAYAPHGLTPPETEFRFEITAPSGEVWTFGPEDSTQRITGTAEDFCLLTTRRRHRDDLSVKAVGAEADQWVGIAQAYRGPAGAGRVAGQFAEARS
jgi:enediyne biosynthesis protein E11